MTQPTDPRSGFIPLLPLKNVVIFPRNVVTLLIGRPSSIEAIEEAQSRDNRIVVTAYRDSSIEEPEPDDLYSIGAMASIAEVEPRETGTIQVILEGLSRVRITRFNRSRTCTSVSVEPMVEPAPAAAEARALIGMIQELAASYGEVRTALPPEILQMVSQSTDPGHLADLLATQMMQDAARRQALLEIVDPIKRLELVAIHLSGEINTAQIERKIKERVRDQIDKNQREYYLREQLKAIHDELGGENGNEIDTLRTKITSRNAPDAVVERLLKEAARLERMPAVSAEATVVRSYIETMLALPWREQTEDRLDLEAAEDILNSDHHGLEPVKERILEFLAVRKLTNGSSAARSQILCFAGPPGVGKTSLGRSIASALGREFVRVSLGGVRDEAEIRGHRRTYIGAMPGRIVGALRQAGTLNPVILLDEIDKMSSDYRGDPASALLEVLDPEQNHQFTDHYVDLPYDLSRVLFVTTANNLGQIPRPLRDRMEVIDIPGYTELEKVEIGKKYLLPKQITAHGLNANALEISNRVWQRLVREYTREAGVRQLERESAAICRRIARDVVRGKTDRVKITESRLVDFLGPGRFGHDSHVSDGQIGLSTGLGVTEVGGELLPVEVLTMPGKGSLTITGKAGDVMQESARAALSYARSRAGFLRIDPDFQSKMDIHIHLPEGATPKDGPSAGITMATALISALTGRPVRGDTALTGEITLLGRVLAIGGLKDKALAAHRHGIRRVVAPLENQRDFARLPAIVKRDITFIWASTMDQVIAEVINLNDIQVDSLLQTNQPLVLDSVAEVEQIIQVAVPAPYIGESTTEAAPPDRN